MFDREHVILASSDYTQMNKYPLKAPCVLSVQRAEGRRCRGRKNNWDFTLLHNSSWHCCRRCNARGELQALVHSPFQWSVFHKHPAGLSQDQLTANAHTTRMERAPLILWQMDLRQQGITGTFDSLVWIWKHKTGISFSIPTSSFEKHYEVCRLNKIKVNWGNLSCSLPLSWTPKHK